MQRAEASSSQLLKVNGLKVHEVKVKTLKIIVFADYLLHADGIQLGVPENESSSMVRFSTQEGDVQSIMRRIHAKIDIRYNATKVCNSAYRVLQH